jgi:hypothetical protein
MTELEKRRERFKQMGLPSGGGAVNEQSVVQTTGGNTNKFSTFNLIKKGAMRGEFRKFLEKTAPSTGSAAGGYQIPETKVGKKRPGMPHEKPTVDIKPETHTPVGSTSEAEMFERMLAGDSGGYGGGNFSAPSQGMPTGDLVQQRGLQTNLDINNMSMPTFNPLAALQKKAAMQRQQQQQGGVQYNAPMNEQEYANPMQTGAQMPFSYQYLKEMMQDVAKEISEKVIRNVLKEYSDNHSNKKQFEVVNKEKNVIKTQDGKYYQLVPVQPKTKSGL